MDVTMMLVTPELASQWLQGNTSNRKLDKGRVARYANDMQAGRWRLTHQGIAVTPEGMLVDGQHRLTAVLQSGCEVPFMVCINADSETFGVVDQGKTRTANDVWRIGRKTDNGVATIAKLVYMYEKHRTLPDWHNQAKLIAPETVFQWAEHLVPRQTKEIKYADVFVESAKYEYRWRKEITGVGSSIGAAMSIMFIYFGVRHSVVWDKAYEPVITCANLQPGTPQYAFHRLLGKRQDRKCESCFSQVLNTGTGATLAKARLAGLLRYIDDVFAERPRSKYKLAVGVSLPAPPADNLDTLLATIRTEQTVEAEVS